MATTAANNMNLQDMKVLKDVIKMYVKKTLDSINNVEKYEDFIYYEG